MERGNYKNKMYISKDTHFRNQRERGLYNRRPNNITRGSSSQYFDNGNLQCHYNDRKDHSIDEHINTQFNRRGEHSYDNYKTQYSRSSTDTNFCDSNDTNCYSNNRNINTQFNQRCERSYDNCKRQYSRSSTNTNFCDSNDMNCHASNRNINTQINRHRETPYDNYKRQYSRSSTNTNFCDSNDTNFSRDTNFFYSHTSGNNSLSAESLLEGKTLELINAVKFQEGIGGRLVFLQTDNSCSATILQNAVQSIKDGVLSVISGKEPGQPQTYELKINGECIATGKFMSKQAARNGLSEVALDQFKKTSFFITKKKHYEEISTKDLNKSPETKSPTTNGMEGSKAHLMMLRMGWGGKGLGINEQGVEKTVAETMTQNITKEGLGGKSIMTEINRILTEFARSPKITTLAFDAGFTKEERAHIHNLAKKLNLKSKSEGKEENRRITVGKKIERWDLVKELLLTNCENEAYKLTIPLDFKDMWSN